MHYTTIKARIKDQSIQLVNQPVLASGSRNVVVIEGDFCELWNNYGKTGVFYRNEAEVYHVLWLGDAVVVPKEVLADDGEFFFGVMGVYADYVRTTEVVRIKVVQGAITAPTLEPGDSTPNIYEQILSKLETMIAMRGDDLQTFELSDEYIRGEIRSNGASAYISFTISGMSLVGGGHHYTDYCIPPALAPLAVTELRTSNQDINVTLMPPNAEGWSRLLIENVGQGFYSVDNETNAFGEYAQGSVFLAELADLRTVGGSFETAGAAMRALEARATKHENDLVALDEAMREGGVCVTFEATGYDENVGVLLLPDLRFEEVLEAYESGKEIKARFDYEEYFLRMVDEGIVLFTNIAYYDYNGVKVPHLREIYWEEGVESYMIERKLSLAPRYVTFTLDPAFDAIGYADGLSDLTREEVEKLLAAGVEVKGKLNNIILTCSYQKDGGGLAFSGVSGYSYGSTEPTFYHVSMIEGDIVEIHRFAGGSHARTDLGNFDSYEEVFDRMDQLTAPGKYKLSDDSDTYLLDVEKATDTYVAQYYWSTDEGPQVKYTRVGQFTNSRWVWSSWS